VYIHLQPGETFEHVHVDQSFTTLVEGEVVLEVNGSRVALVTGLPTLVDANSPHRLVNTGRSIASVKCVHTGIKIKP
jgi:uncharacterized cupin superfamily protein